MREIAPKTTLSTLLDDRALLDAFKRFFAYGERQKVPQKVFSPLLRCAQHVLSAPVAQNRNPMPNVAPAQQRNS